MKAPRYPNEIMRMNTKTRAYLVNYKTCSILVDEKSFAQTSYVEIKAAISPTLTNQVKVVDAAAL